MRVFNLTTGSVVYRGVTIPGNGGSVEFPGLTVLILPERDKKLAERKILAFGMLPSWWTKRARAVESTALPRPTPTQPPPPSVPEVAVVTVVDEPVVTDLATLVVTEPPVVDAEPTDDTQSETTPARNPGRRKWNRG